ncbi:unnamed protein product [marine sediment metagenome]|uniref:Uncharacterized protein n=1 Tax=marine sediment metagenome TaxID=412755 RepID=X0WJL8_9ZZZZ
MMKMSTRVWIVMFALLVVASAGCRSAYQRGYRDASVPFLSKYAREVCSDLLKMRLSGQGDTKRCAHREMDLQYTLHSLVEQTTPDGLDQYAAALESMQWVKVYRATFPCPPYARTNLISFVRKDLDRSDEFLSGVPNPGAWTARRWSRNLRALAADTSSLDEATRSALESTLRELQQSD